MLQRWLNVFNLRGKLFRIWMLMDASGRVLLMRYGHSEKSWQGWRTGLTNRAELYAGDRYLELAEKREANESFVYAG